VNKKIFQSIRSVGSRFWLPIAAFILIGISQILAGNYSFVVFQRLLDGFSSASHLTDMMPLLLMYIGINILNHTLIYLSGYPASILDRGVVQWVKLCALEKISRIDYLAYQNLGTGNLIQVIENGAEATRKILTGFYLSIPGMIAQIVIALAFIRYYDRTLFAVILGGYGIFYLVSHYLMKFLRAELEKMLFNQENFSSFSVRAFMELVVFRVNGHFKSEFERLNTISDEIVRSRARIYLVQELSYTGFALLIFLITAAVVVQQAARIIAGQSTVGTLVALVGFIGVVFVPIIDFSRSWMAYRLDAVAYSHLDRFLSMPEDSGLQQGQPLVISQGTVSFEHVTFGYADQRLPALAEGQAQTVEVLADFSLVIPGGQTTALVGPSGSGKSTLVRLLLHLLKPESGRVLVDGQDLAQVNLQSYYQSAAYIPQEPPIFDGTLRENLIFDRPVPAAQVADVIRRVGLEALVDRLPAGMETLVGERGIKLSGGERQRLAFGRVLLQNPHIVILDEPTSALDSLTEDFINRGLTDFLRGKTVIIVSHRLQTVKSAHQIIVLDAGRIVQQGTLESLLAEEGMFNQLWEKQMRQREDQRTNPNIIF
jgi:ATP-binding cassette, subfamily B, bacterial